MGQVSYTRSEIFEANECRFDAILRHELLAFLSDGLYAILSFMTRTIRAQFLRSFRYSGGPKKTWGTDRDRFSISGNVRTRGGQRPVPSAQRRARNQRRIRRPHPVEGCARSVVASRRQGDPRRFTPVPTQPSRATRKNSRRPGRVGKRPNRGPRTAEKRKRCGRHDLALLSGHRHCHRARQEGPGRLHGFQR